jgi:hypothetical protein
MLRVWVSMSGRASDQAARDVALEDQLRIQSGGGHIEPWPLLDVPREHGVAQRRVLDVGYLTAQVGGVLVRLRREGVQGETPVPEKISPLGRWDDRKVQAAIEQHRAHGVHARTSVRPHGGKEPETDPELIEQLTNTLGEGRLEGLELTPVRQCKEMMTAADLARKKAAVSLPRPVGSLRDAHPCYRSQCPRACHPRGGPTTGRGTVEGRPTRERGRPSS